MADQARPRSAVQPKTAARFASTARAAIGLEERSARWTTRPNIELAGVAPPCLGRRHTSYSRSECPGRADGSRPTSVTALNGLPLRERCIHSEPALKVGSLPLDEVGRQSGARHFRFLRHVKRRVHESKQRPEALLDAAVWRRGRQDMCLPERDPSPVSNADVARRCGRLAASQRCAPCLR